MTQEQVDAIHRVDDAAILGFFEEYRWLSNYESCKIKLGDYTFNSSEAAYMAEKTDNPEQKAHLASLATGSEAKKYGQKVDLKPDWDKIKVGAMSKILLAKFEQNPPLAEKLVATGEKYLEETNWWHDTFWGVCEGVGNNSLGKLLMMVRRQLKVQG